MLDVYLESKICHKQGGKDLGTVHGNQLLIGNLVQLRLSSPIMQHRILEAKGSLHGARGYR